MEFGRTHNPTKNPVAEKAISEMHAEIVRYLPNGGQLSPSMLAAITSQLNSRLRHHGLSAWEVLHQRDQFSGNQIDISDILRFLQLFYYSYP